MAKFKAFSPAFSPFPSSIGSLLQNTRMDAALDAMRPYGFSDQFVRETVKNLLKVGFLFLFFSLLLKQGHFWGLVVFDINKLDFCFRFMEKMDGTSLRMILTMFYLKPFLKNKQMVRKGR
jgi:hypothetical protein